MGKRKILSFLLITSIIFSNTVSAYAEELYKTEQTDSMNQEESVEQKESYEVLDVLMETSEIQTERKITVKVIMNTTEGIKKAVISGFAKEKAAEVHYESTSLNESEIIFEIVYGDYEKDEYKLDKLTVFFESEEMIYDMSEYGDFSYIIYGMSAGDSVDEIMLFTTRNPMFTGANGNDGRFVVVLDPGHDPECTDRSWVNGVWEPDLNWRMAEALKTELEKYAGVEVYINRTWEECPGIVDADDDFYCLERRVVRAAEMDADLVISLHNNAAVWTPARLPLPAPVQPSTTPPMALTPDTVWMQRPTLLRSLLQTVTSCVLMLWPTESSIPRSQSTIIRRDESGEG